VVCELNLAINYIIIAAIFIMLTFLSARSVHAAKGSTLKGASRKWMDRHINDPFVKQAKIVGHILTAYPIFIA
jgi:hypothetical protein